MRIKLTMLRLSARVLSEFFSGFHPMKNRLDAFYMLAFIPLPILAYFNVSYLSPLIFGFLLFLLKKDKLSFSGQAIHIQRALGVMLALGSFIAFCVFIFLFQSLIFSAATYVMYIVGLLLTFSDLSALKEAFSSIFIVVAAASISFISNWLEPILSPHIIPLFTTIVVAISNFLGVKATIQYPDIILLHTWSGTIPIQIIWGCIGVYGALIFSTLMIVLLYEEPGSLTTKTLWAIIGVIGVLLLNIVRIAMILVADSYYGAEVAAQFHSVLGYVLFFTWLAFFLYTFSRRQTILRKILSIRQRLH